MDLPVSKIVFEVGRILILAFLVSSLYALDSWLGGGFAGLLFEAFCKCHGVVVDLKNYVTDVNAEFTLVHYEVFVVQMVLITFFAWGVTSAIPFVLQRRAPLAAPRRAPVDRKASLNLCGGSVSAAQMRRCRRKSEKSSLIRKKLLWLQAHADLDRMIKQRFYRDRSSKLFK